MRARSAVPPAAAEDSKPPWPVRPEVHCLGVEETQRHAPTPGNPLTYLTPADRRLLAEATGFDVSSEGWSRNPGRKTVNPVIFVMATDREAGCLQGCEARLLDGVSSGAGSGRAPPAPRSGLTAEFVPFRGLVLVRQQQGRELLARCFQHVGPRMVASEPGFRPAGGHDERASSALDGVPVIAGDGDRGVKWSQQLSHEHIRYPPRVKCSSPMKARAAHGWVGPVAHPRASEVEHGLTDAECASVLGDIGEIEEHLVDLLEVGQKVSGTLAGTQLKRQAPQRVEADPADPRAAIARRSTLEPRRRAGLS